MEKLTIATANKHKFEEIVRILNPDELGMELIFGGDSVSTTPDETGNTFYENAYIKAKYYSEHTNSPALADDSGLIVLSLNNQPGIYSSRYAGQNATFQDNNRKLLEVMKNIPEDNRNAYFICIAVLYLPENKSLWIGGGLDFSTEGILSGKIAFAPSGTGGFGYDPIFQLPDGHTVAEISAEKKNKISHRAKAFQKMKSILMFVKRKIWTGNN